MIRIFSSGVPLKNGIISMTRVYESLIDADVDPIRGWCSNYTCIRQQTQQSLEKSEQAASRGLRDLDEHLEKLTEVEGKCEQQIRDTESTLSNLLTDQMSNEKLMNDCYVALEQARHNLGSAEETQRNQEKRRHDAEIVTRVGGALFLIPVVGWITGAAMLSAGAVGSSEASAAISVADEEVRKSESEVETSRSRVSDCMLRIVQLEFKIRQKLHEMEQIHKELQQVKEQRQGVAEFQRKVRRASNSQIHPPGTSDEDDGGSDEGSRTSHRE